MRQWMPFANDKRQTTTEAGNVFYGAVKYMYTGIFLI